MTTFFLALFVLLLVVLGMSIGVLLGRKPIAGTCGGMSALGMKTSCDICGGDQSRCEKEKKITADANKQPSAAFYDASKSSKM